MPIPVISPITSIQSYARSEYFDFQPVATNVPTSWTATLPAGLTINEDTGLVSGSITEQGIYDLSIIATNGDGDSAPLVFPIRIRPSSIVAGISLELDMDVQDGTVTRTDGKPMAVPVKYGDTLLVSLGIKKLGQLLPAPAMTLIRFGIKEFEADPLVELTSGLFRMLGAYESRRYLIELNFNQPRLRSWLSGYGTARTSTFPAIAEIELTFFETTLEGEDPAKQVRSSESFTLQLTRDLLPNIA